MTKVKIHLQIKKCKVSLRYPQVTQKHSDANKVNTGTIIIKSMMYSRLVFNSLIQEKISEEETLQKS